MTSLTEFFNRHEDEVLKGISHKNSLIKRNIIAHMALNGECTLSELTRELHISVPTITKLVQELVDETIVCDLGKVETPGGRRPNVFGLANSAIYFAGVNVGRDNMSYLITDLQNNIIKQQFDTSFELLDRSQCLEKICANIERFIATCGIDRGKILGLGVGITGRVNPDTGRSYKYFTSSEQSLRDLLEHRIGIRVLLENDTRARCYAEYTCSKSKDDKNLLYLHLGRGVAIGIVTDGKLYYGSIASGRDEAHCFDLGEGREYRLSTSTYGSFAPAPADSGAVWTTTYDRKGYRITRQENIEPIPVAPSQLPVDLVNPPRRRWNVVNLDTVRYTPADSASLHRKYPARRYRKGLHLLRAHSWAPVSFDPFKTIEEFNPRLMWGATVLSQNLLSSTEAFASWGWSRSDGHVLKGTIRYSGLGVRLEARATYGGDRMTYGIAQRGADGKAERQPAPAHAKYWSAAAGATLPLYFDRGHHIRQLSISAGWEYSNGMVADVDAIRYDAEGRIANLQTLGYREGLHKLSLGIGFSDVVRAAYRDVGTPWGYTLWAGYDLNPENRNFSDLVSAYARIYTPGFFRHNSLSVAAAYQTSVGGYRFPSGLRFLGYKSTRLLPRGFSSSDISSNNYLAGSVDYQFPLCYPEGGISGVIYFKRIRLNVGADYARFQEFGSRGKTWRDIYSYGGDLLLDLNILRMSAAATATVKLSLYKPSEGSCWFGFGLELPF